MATKQSIKCAGCKLMECPADGKFYCFANHWDDVEKVKIEQVENCCDFISKIPAEQLAAISQKRLEKKTMGEAISEITEAQIELRQERILKYEQELAMKRDFSCKRIAAELQAEFEQEYQPFIPYPMSYKEAKNILHTIFSIECAKKGRKMIYTDENKEAINILLSYFIGIQDPEPEADKILSHKKGIYLWGNKGCGKSFIMRCLAKFCNKMEDIFIDAKVPFTPRRFKSVECEMIVDDVEKDKETNSMTKYYTGEWCYEDFGFVDSTKIWGNNISVISKIMLRRGNSFDQTGLKTHLTCNIEFGKLNEIYDERLVSRFNAMYHSIYLGGPDYRKK